MSFTIGSKKEGRPLMRNVAPLLSNNTTKINNNLLKINTSLNDLPESEEIKTPFDLSSILASCQVDPTKEITAPPVILEIRNNDGKSSPAFTLGNFSLLIGKAKSRKTFLETAIVAAAVSGDYMLDRIYGTLPTEKNTVLLFDTEQSEYHLNRTVRRACRLVNDQDPENFKAFGLRKFKPSERLQIIEFALYTIPNIGFVAIDGLRDLLTRGINDEEEATEITSKLLRWTAELNIHILLVLHQNKGDLNARGHVGTEAVNKAETVISVSLSNCKEISIVEAEFTRDMPFEPFAFTIDEESGLPVECDMPNGEKEKSKVLFPDQIEDAIHFEVLANIYRKNKLPNYNELTDSIINQFGMKSIRFGRSKCRPFIAYYISKEWIVKEKDGKNVLYKYTRALF